MFHADGTLASGAIALCEVQGYVYLAYRVAARLAAGMDDVRLAAGLTLKAETLRRSFEQTYWDEEIGTYALALDGEKRPCAVRTSNAGQLLFTGICAPERAARVVQGLFDPDFFTGWGVRTVNRRERRYNPASYHNGSVWPHDNALIGLGLARYGHCSEAVTLTTALFDAASHMHLRRLPELFCGFERKGANPLPGGLCTASLGGGGALCTPAGVPRPRGRWRRRKAKIAQAEVAALY